MQPEPLLLLPQLVQLVRPQRRFSNALMLDEGGRKSILVDIFGVALFEADIVVVDGPQMAPPQQGRQVIVARGWRSHGSAALSEGGDDGQSIQRRLEAAASGRQGTVCAFSFSRRGREARSKNSPNNNNEGQQSIVAKRQRLDIGA